jgi:predicted adenine nucleotide alpha hydrolase (AANH) superfamily ATPase
MENYDRLMEAEIARLAGEKKRLLLHSCCAPCSTRALELLADAFQLTVYYYNPNIEPRAEYEHRLSEQARLLSAKGIALAEGEWDPAPFLAAARGMEGEPEGGARCFLCYETRLSGAARYAKENGFDYFATTLTVSPHKNAQKLNEIGFRLGEEVGVAFLPTDFKKRGGYQRSVELSREYGLYRQDYCGCRYSARN